MTILHRVIYITCSLSVRCILENDNLSYLTVHSYETRKRGQIYAKILRLRLPRYSFNYYSVKFELRSGALLKGKENFREKEHTEMQNKGFQDEERMTRDKWR